MTTRMKFFAAPIMASAFALAACGEPADTVEPVETMEPATDTMADTGTIVDVAGGNPDFSTLVSAVTQAGLGETLMGDGPFTVFAPTNAAFEKVDEATMTELMSDEGKATLTGILTYHVVAGNTSGAALAQAITDGGGTAELTTVNGAVLKASMDGENVILTDAAGGTSMISATDVAASNGVIHAIDTVLMPS